MTSGSDDHLLPALARLVDELINCLLSAPVMSRNEAQRIREEQRETQWDSLMSGNSYGQSVGVPELYDRNEKEFFAYLKSRKDNLEFNVRTLACFLMLHFEKAEPVPPYYAWRVAVVLRRMKDRDRERRFLAAWCKHFGDREAGSRYKDLVERAEKMGAVPIACSANGR